MKLYLGKPRNHWISPHTIVEYMFFWTEWSKCGRNPYDEKYFDNYVEPPKWADNLADRLTFISHALQWILDRIHPPIDYIKVDYWDTWSMDKTLSPVILQLLKQLKATKQGSGFIDDADVPWELRSYSVPRTWSEWETDPLIHDRYDWALDEMIWTFEQLSQNDHEAKFFDHSECDYSSGDFLSHMGKIKIDKEGLHAHNQRIQRGTTLFGKYFQTLWD